MGAEVREAWEGLGTSSHRSLKPLKGHDLYSFGVRAVGGLQAEVGTALSFQCLLCHEYTEG